MFSFIPLNIIVFLFLQKSMREVMRNRKLNWCGLIAKLTVRLMKMLSYSYLKISPTSNSLPVCELITSLFNKFIFKFHGYQISVKSLIVTILWDLISVVSIYANTCRNPDWLLASFNGV